MALIKCPECGGTVSDAAITCPHCGYPLKTQIVEKKAGQAIFKCELPPQTGTVFGVVKKDGFSIIHDGKCLAKGRMGDMVSIPVPKTMTVTVRVESPKLFRTSHGSENVTLKEGVTTFVNISYTSLTHRLVLQTTSDGSILSDQSTLGRVAAEKKANTISSSNSGQKTAKQLKEEALRESGITQQKKLEVVHSPHKIPVQPSVKETITMCDLCKRELKNEMKYVVVIEDKTNKKKNEKKKMNICESCLVKEKKNGNIELLSSIKVK